MENKKQTFCIESLKEKHKVSEAVFLQAVKRFEMSAVSGREGAKG